MNNAKTNGSVHWMLVNVILCVCKCVCFCSVLGPWHSRKCHRWPFYTGSVICIRDASTLYPSNRTVEHTLECNSHSLKIKRLSLYSRCSLCARNMSGSAQLSANRSIRAVQKFYILEEVAWEIGEENEKSKSCAPSNAFNIFIIAWWCCLLRCVRLDASQNNNRPGHRERQWKVHWMREEMGRHDKTEHS